MDIATLKLNPDNPQVFTKQTIEKLKSSIREFPKMMKLRPLVYDPETMHVLGGNKRLIALMELGYNEIPDEWVKSAAELTEDEKKRFIIQDNVQLGEWDFEKLNLWNADDLIDWGMDIEKEDIIEKEPEAYQDVEEVNFEVSTEIKEGDLIEIGNHRLICGDALLPETWEKLMAGEKADAIITDPPYNINYQGKNLKREKILNDDQENYTGFTYLTIANQLNHLKKGGAFYIFYGIGQQLKFVSGMKKAGAEIRQNLIWVKDSFVISRQDYNWQFEPIAYGWKDGAAHYFIEDYTKSTIIENNDLSKMPKSKLIKLLTEAKTDILRHERPKRSKEHPTMKPVSLIADLMKNSTRQNEIIIDAFAGSGTTMVTAHQLNRTAYVIELVPEYCQVIIDRMKKLDPDIKIRINGKLCTPKSEPMLNAIMKGDKNIE